MHVLVTGHTGFKGAWLTLLLTSRGHEVTGLALDPDPNSLFELADVATGMRGDIRGDIRDAALTAGVIADAAPDVVMHLAAQPLVRESYRDPRTTFETNVMGTLNVLQAVSSAPSVKAHVVITTDKVYQNVNRVEGYRESDPLGAADPYSTSKAMSDLLAQSWAASFGGAPSAIARAGNVIGGGDSSADRLLPDLIRSFAAGQQAVLRYPDAVRPWQHVLDCLDGYLALVDALLDGRGVGEWNFGPGPESFVTVRDVADLVASEWGDGATWVAPEGEHWHEAGLLALDAEKAEDALAWTNLLRFPESLVWTVEWHKRVIAGESARTVTLDQLSRYENLRAARG